MSQLSSRGLRKAPVKKTRDMWTAIAPTKRSAVQWCDLPHEQAGADVEAEVHRPSRRRPRRPLRRAGRTARRSAAAGAGTKKNVRNVPVGEQDHEAEERHLAEEEGPVVGEDLPQSAASGGGSARSDRRSRRASLETRSGSLGLHAAPGIATCARLPVMRPGPRSWARPARGSRRARLNVPSAWS